MSKKSRAVELCGRVVAGMNKERWHQAIKLLKGNLSLVKTDWKLSWNLAWCYFKLERFEQARIHMIRAGKLSPKNAGCKLGLGAIYLQMKQFKKAQANCTVSLQIRDNYVARLTLALACMKQGKLKEAENVHLEGIRLKPKHSLRYEAYADYLSDVGRENEAQTMYRKAKKLARRFPDNRMFPAES